ncbi:PREDICTED: multidrug resistance-associated protein 4-like [Ceratosolen solmsi marchali]|uniref:Multidrug resistance-associated protein 4-like n=1 Tax=Ceratosolen solmsi marchali TaxID=326594 RepID=A0AAJ6YBB0_9HYME|nr:PREDICTED: multidrug resistance-associated protein 4-like [Ceratosolen solmsi marchali]
MDTTKSFNNPNPRESANSISVLVWWWTLSLFKKGYRKILGPDDLYDPIRSDKSNVLGDRLETQWKAELQKARKGKRYPSLLKTILRTFIFECFILGCVQILNEFVLRLGTPILLGALLQYFKPEPTTTYEAALIYAGGISIATAINVITINQHIFGAFHLGGRVRIAVCSVVYRKALSLSNSALGDTAPGKIVNLVANDVNRFDLVFVFLHHMWSAPLSALVIAYFLYHAAGYAGIIGIIAVFIVVPIQAYTGKLSSKFRLQTAIKTDERVRLMDEIISGVQVIKMYAWEKPFCALIELARRLELKGVTKSSYIRGIYMTFNIFTTRMALYCTLVAMLLSGDRLSADTVFVFSAYFAILAHTMSGMFVRGVAEIAECMVAVNRLQTFLTYEEFESGNVTSDFLLSTSNGTINSDSRYSSIKASKQDLPYIDEDVNHDEGSSDKRRQSYVLASELLKRNSEDTDSKNSNNTNHDEVRDELYSVKLKHVTAKWDLHSSETTTLDNINVKIERGKMYIVIGMVGSGKTSLLSTILGELHLLQGAVRVKGGISYASQDAWVFGASVRQNIVFGQEFDRQRYQKVVKVCALLKDFKQFPQGDQTIVGERGSSLSGGQRARINLARAVYRQADIYLLDDPLSAVDTHVGKHLFEECLQRYLNTKTRILATHQLQYIKNADSIILMEQGKIRQYSDYRELLDKHPEYSSLIAEERRGETSNESSIDVSHIRRQFSSSSTRSRTPDASVIDSDAEDEEDDAAQLADFIEGTSRGTVKGSIILNYFRAGLSFLFASVLIFLFLLTQFMANFNDYFIPVLVTAEESRAFYADQRKHEANNSTFSINKSMTIIEESKILAVEQYIYIYTLIVVAVFVIGITRSFAFYNVCMRCSQRLHDLVFGALIRASMRFFDTNPSGRILNRFSKDMGAIDELLPKAILDSAQIILMMFGSLIVVSIINPIFLVPIIFIAFIFYWIRKIYLKTSKNIKRLEGMTRSPVFTHLNATLNGLTTIRAYKAEKILKKEFDKFQDIHTSSWYMFIATSTAFGFSLDIFCFIFTTLVTFSFLLLKETFTGGQVGLAITQVMAMTGMIQWGIRQSVEVTNQMMSVERILEYTELVPESNLRDMGTMTKRKKRKQVQENMLIETPDDWPNQGHVEFKNVYMRYSEDDAPVLKGLTMSIRPSDKVGIVGRTGAGKSSLISALFRLAKVEGVIEIDGINTGNIALEDLRKHISIIPQDPVLFSGTLRRNLDPFDEFADKVLWDVLEEVELKDAVMASGNGLYNRVLDRGSNYSVGQRQMICLARAILRNNKILMLDEATANVDPQTDSLIQRTIRNKFAPCTVLTIAHRLNTIMDSDKVLVMDRGRLVEFDHPHILLQNEYGQFTSLVKETGRAMYEQLFKVASQAYYAKRTET